VTSSPDQALKPARRFLHACYCCTGAKADSVVRFFVEQLSMRNTMSSPIERGSGALLGLEGEVESGASFLYDERGPRVSPAIEVQAWVDPPLVGSPIDDPTEVGIRSLGLTVPDVDDVTERLRAFHCVVAGAGESAFGNRWVTIRDPTGVTIDLVEDGVLPVGHTRMRHLRITVNDLAKSLPWYEGLGFEVVDRTPIDDAEFLGLDGVATAEAVRLRLPDEAFEAMLIQWNRPPSHGRHVSEPNHAGLFRAAVGVDDTRASFDAMSAAGWTFDRRPARVELHGTPVPDMWICFISDPDGIPYEFVQRPREAFRVDRGDR
jgi:catechol 2,3-dioxygenase-like lactoylglutathione lyase family enzyme